MTITNAISAVAGAIGQIADTREAIYDPAVAQSRTVGAWHRQLTRHLQRIDDAWTERAAERHITLAIKAATALSWLGADVSSIVREVLVLSQMPEHPTIPPEAIERLARLFADHAPQAQ